MKRFELRHVLPKDRAETFALLFGEEYEREAQARSSVRRTLVETTEEGPIRTKRYLVESDASLPKPIAKVLGSDKLSYELVEETDRERHSVNWEVIPSKMADRVKAVGTYQILDGPEAGTCERVIVGEVTVDIAFVGKMIESTIASEVEKSYSQSTAFAIDFLSRR